MATITTTESRRAFLRGFLGTAAGGAAVAALSACAVATGGGAEGASYQVGVIAPTEIVPLRPGVHYAANMPSRVPAVRTLESAGAIY
jgi:hypothetical protein